MGAVLLSSSDERSVATYFLSIGEVVSVTGLSRSELYRRIAAGSFPAQCKFGARASRWVAREVAHWCEARIQDRDLGAKI